MVRYRVLGMLCLLSFILYLDRVCIGQALPYIMSELGLSNSAGSYVGAAFTLAYALFEVPIGHWGDRYGSRGVLAAIAIWWSVFTMLTGASTGLALLIAIRFLFGIGEAGALPNIARVVARWFPAEARGPAQGWVLTSALIGGAASPVFAEPLLQAVGWRLAFVVLGVPGILWAAAFFWWFRDDPARHPAVTSAERDLIGAPQSSAAAHHPAIPWRNVLGQANLWLLGGALFSTFFTSYLVLFWYPTYLQRAHGALPGHSSWLAGMVVAAGAVGSVLGGYLSDAVVRSTGRRRGRCFLGAAALASAALAMAAGIHCDSLEAATACTGWAFLAVNLQLPIWWSVVSDLSGKHLGALFGLLNSLGFLGAIASQLFLGHLADWLGSLGYLGRAQWDPAFYVYALILVLGASCWLIIDPAQSLVERRESSS